MLNSILPPVRRRSRVRDANKPLTIGLIALSVLFSLCGQVRGHDYRCSPDDDLQRVADKLQPGDRMLLAHGKYHQQFIVRAKGTQSKPIQIVGGKGVQFSGLTELKDLGWQAGENGVYRALVRKPVKQLFADGELLTPARWPDMTFAERWDNSKWPAADEGTTCGTMVDADLAATEIDFTDCVAILNIGSWQTFRRVISRHGKGVDRFSYKTDPKSRLHHETHPIGMDRYCIYGKAALDVPGEWYYEAKSSTLFLIPPSGKTPRDLKLESKQIAEAIVVADSKYVELRDIELFGSTARIAGSDHCMVQNVHVQFGSTITNPFGPNLPHPAISGSLWNARKWFGETSVDALFEVTGNDNVIRDVTVRFSEGPALTVGGQRNLIENCLFQDIDWHGLDYGFGIDLLAATPITVRRVTLDHCGGSEGLRLANHGPSVVEYCHLHHCGLRQSDGAIIQASTAGVAGTEIRFNWIHDHNAFHWGGNGIRGDDKTRGLLVHHNVVWNCREKGIVTKGDSNTVYHNTCFNNPKIDILLPRNRLPGKPEEQEKQNQKSQAYNNIGSVTGSWSWEKSKLRPYAKTGNNEDLDSDILRDASNHDFRLKRNASAIDAGRVLDNTSDFHGKAPDLGAYESGSERWTAGYQR